MFGFHPERDVMQGRTWPVATRDVQIGETKFKCCEACAENYATVPGAIVAPKES